MIVVVGSAPDEGGCVWRAECTDAAPAIPPTVGFKGWVYQHRESAGLGVGGGLMGSDAAHRTLVPRAWMFLEPRLCSGLCHPPQIAAPRKYSASVEAAAGRQTLPTVADGVVPPSVRSRVGYSLVVVGRRRRRAAMGR